MIVKGAIQLGSSKGRFIQSESTNIKLPSINSVRQNVNSFIVNDPSGKYSGTYYDETMIPSNGAPINRFRNVENPDKILYFGSIYRIIDETEVSAWILSDQSTADLKYAPGSLSFIPKKWSDGITLRIKKAPVKRILVSGLTSTLTNGHYVATKEFKIVGHNPLNSSLNTYTISSPCGLGCYKEFYYKTIPFNGALYPSTEGFSVILPPNAFIAVRVFNPTTNTITNSTLFGFSTNLWRIVRFKLINQSIVLDGLITTNATFSSPEPWSICCYSWSQPAVFTVPEPAPENGTGLWNNQLYQNGSIATTFGNYSIAYENGGVTLSNYAGDETQVNIPAQVFGVPVKKISDNAFVSKTSITSVTIPNSVTSIGNGAFGNCFNLANITVPNSVTSIGSFAFDGCTALTTVVIPNSVNSIGDDAFLNTVALTSIVLPQAFSTQLSRIGLDTQQNLGIYHPGYLYRVIISNAGVDQYAADQIINGSVQASGTYVWDGQTFIGNKPKYVKNNYSIFWSPSQNAWILGVQEGPGFPLLELYKSLDLVSWVHGNDLPPNNDEDQFMDMFDIDDDNDEISDINEVMDNTNPLDNPQPHQYPSGDFYYSTD